MRKGSYEWYLEKYKQQIKETARMNYRDKLKVMLSLDLGTVKEINSTLYGIIKNEFPNLDDKDTLDTARMTKLMKKVFMESSMKALELTYKLDGSLSDLSVEPDYETLERELEDIK